MLRLRDRSEVLFTSKKKHGDKDKFFGALEKFKPTPKLEE